MTLKLPFASAVVLALLVTACGQDNKKDESADEATEAGQSSADDLTLNNGAASTVLVAQSLKVTGIESEGAGCPAESISTNISPDAQAFTVLFSEFQVVVEPEGRPQRVVRRCDVTAALEVPQGWQFAVVSIDQRGFADLPKGTKAKLTTSIHFTEKKAGKKVQTKLHGPYSDDFQVSKAVKVAATKWSRCGGQTGLEIDMEAIVRVKKNQGALFTIDSLDGELQQTLALKWQKCK